MSTMSACRTSALLVAMSLVMATPAVATTTTTTATATSVAASALPSFVAQMPACVAGCLPTVGKEIGCDTTDLKCMCDQENIFDAHMDTCMLKACSKDDRSAGEDLQTEICAAMSSHPDAAAIASASSLITIKAPQPTATKNGAERIDPGLFMAGFAILGAFSI